MAAAPFRRLRACNSQTDPLPEKGDIKMILRLKAISWTRVVVDTLLVASILLASSSLISVR